MIPGDRPSGERLGARHPPGRIAAPLVLWVGAVAGVFGGLLLAGGRIRPPVEFWCAVLIGASIIVQPLVISPHFPGFEANEQRLTALGLLPPLRRARLPASRRGELRCGRARPGRWARARPRSLAASLHDKFTVVGPQGNGQFVALELLAAAVLGGSLAAVVGARAPGHPRGASAARLRHSVI